MRKNNNINNKNNIINNKNFHISSQRYSSSHSHSSIRINNNNYSFRDIISHSPSILIVYIILLYSFLSTSLCAIPQCGVEISPINGDNTVCYGEQVSLEISTNLTTQIILKLFNEYTSSPYSSSGTIIDFQYSPIDSYFYFPSLQSSSCPIWPCTLMHSPSIPTVS